MLRATLSCFALAMAVTTNTAVAAEPPSYTITIHDNKFDPVTLTVPAGERIKLIIKNTRTMPSEFESAELGREKVVPGSTTLDLWIGPLKPGKYQYIDEFNPPVSGWVVATEQSD